jgi:hypothetical protein
MGDARTYFRQVALGLPTIFGVRAQGFFIPYRYADRVDTNSVHAPYPFIDELFAKHADSFGRILRAVDSYRSDLGKIGENKPPEPRWDQVWFPRLDASVAYTLVRELKPRRIVEVGSGHSTRFMTRAIRDGGLATRFTAIDPMPRANLNGLQIEWIQAMQGDADPAIFAALESGDILFIDSSHILMPGTDVDQLINHILPTLPVGVYIHIHDIFLPDAYPADWDWRGYNEQSIVAALLQGGAYEPIFGSRYVTKTMRDALNATIIAQLPAVDGLYGASLWLRKKAPSL